MSKFITLICNEDKEILTHLPNHSVGYDTLCGLAGMSDTGNIREGYRGVGDIHTEIPTPSKKKVDCKMCFEIWNHSKKYRKSDFVFSVSSGDIK